MTTTAPTEGDKEAVVWLDLSSSGYAWWPCRVEGDAYVSFQDNCSYDAGTVKGSKVRPYDHEDIAAMVSKGRQKLKRKTATSLMYDQALKQAVQFINSHINPSFQLNLEANGCVGDKSNASCKSEKASVSENVPCDPSLKQYPVNGKKRDRQGNILGLKNSGSEEKDAVRWEAGCEDEILHGNERQQKKPKSCSSIRRARNSPMQAKTDRKGRRKKKSIASVTSPDVSTGIEATTSSQSSYKAPSPVESTDKTPPPTEPLYHQLPVTPSMASSTPALMASTPIDLTSGCATVPTSSSHIAAAPCPIEVDSEDDCNVCGSDSESDDDLPAIDLSIKESVNLYELKPGNVVWAKYGKWPFWPALVSKVYGSSKRRKSALTQTKRNVTLYFFGYNEKMQLKIANKKKIAPFGTKNSTEYTKYGKAYNVERVQFEQAVKEARDLVRDMADGLYKDIHDPKEIFLKAISNRPMDYNSDLPVGNLSETADSEDEDEDKEVKEEEEQVSILCLNEGSSDEEEMNEEEKEKENAVYSYEQVKAEVRQLHPLLEKIAQGEVSSEFHNIFVSGSRKEQSGLKYGTKYGPILKGWQHEEIIRLLHEELLVVAKKVSFDFSYAFDVLLPEAMVRLIAKNDSTSYSDALEKFYS